MVWSYGVERERVCVFCSFFSIDVASMWRRASTCGQSLILAGAGGRGSEVGGGVNGGGGSGGGDKSSQVRVIRRTGPRGGEGGG